LTLKTLHFPYGEAQQSATFAQQFLRGQKRNKWATTGQKATQLPGLQRHILRTGERVERNAKSLC
jgi:hypothetical protein